MRKNAFFEDASENEERGGIGAISPVILAGAIFEGIDFAILDAGGSPGSGKSIELSEPGNEIPKKK